MGLQVSPFLSQQLEATTHDLFHKQKFMKPCLN